MLLLLAVRLCFRLTQQQRRRLWAPAHCGSERRQSSKLFGLWRARLRNAGRFKADWRWATAATAAIAAS